MKYPWVIMNRLIWRVMFGSGAFYYVESDGENPRGPETSEGRVLRGGA